MYRNLAILFQLEAVLPKGSLNSRRPDYVFRLEYAAEQEARFQDWATPHGTFQAFHGSSVERFHSILHNGLLNMFNKVHSSPKLLSCRYFCSKKLSLGQSFLSVITFTEFELHNVYVTRLCIVQTSAFGEGTYLSTHMGVSINWSSAGSLWQCSNLPPTVSCMAVCEVIRHPSIM